MEQREYTVYYAYKQNGPATIAMAAASEVAAKLTAGADKDVFVGDYWGRNDEAPRLSGEELRKLQSLLNSL